MRPGTDRGLVGDLKVVHSAEVRTAFGYSERDPSFPLGSLCRLRPRRRARRDEAEARHGVKNKAESVAGTSWSHSLRRTGALMSCL